MDASKVQAWKYKANAGSINLFEESHSGCPKMWLSVEVEQQIETIYRNRGITQRQLTKTGAVLGTVNKMIKTQNFQRINTKLVLKLFTNEMKADRKEAAQQLLAHYHHEGEWFLQNIVTRDKPWITHYNLRLKQQSTEYHHPTLPQRKKIWTEEAAQIVMLTVFWDLEGVVHREFLHKGCSINSECDIQTLKTTKMIKTCLISSPHSTWQCATTHKYSHNNGYRVASFSHHSSPSLQHGFGAKWLLPVPSFEKASEGSVLHIGWWTEGSCVTFFSFTVAGILWNWYLKTYIVLVVLHWIIW